MALKVLSILTLVFVLTASAAPADERAVKKEIVQMRNHLRMHIEELDNRIQQIRTMQDTWQKRHDELDQRALQMDADHQKRVEEFETRVAEHMKGVATEELEDQAEEEEENDKDADEDEIPHKRNHKQSHHKKNKYHHHGHRFNKDFDEDQDS